MAPAAELFSALAALLAAAVTDHTICAAAVGTGFLRGAFAAQQVIQIESFITVLTESAFST